MIQYLNILSKDGKSLLFRSYGISKVDKDILSELLNSFLGVKNELNQTKIKCTKTEKFQYFFSKINNGITLVVCTDLMDDNFRIKSKILRIKTKLIEKYPNIIKNDIVTSTISKEFIRIIDKILIDVKIAIIGYGSNSLLQLICGDYVSPKYISAANIEILMYDEVKRSLLLSAFPEDSRTWQEGILEDSDIVLVVINSIWSGVNRTIFKELNHIPWKHYKNKTVIGIANFQDMPERLSLEFIKKITSEPFSHQDIDFYGIDTSNLVYREKIRAILSNIILKLSNGYENETCDQCGNAFISDFFEILKKSRMRVKDLSYCPKCNFPLRYIHYEDCIKIRSYNPLVKSSTQKHIDNKLNKRFTENWIDYLGIISNEKEQTYSNIDFDYSEGDNKIDYVSESFFAGTLDEKILEIYSPYIKKSNFPRTFEHLLSLPRCFF